MATISTWGSPGDGNDRDLLLSAVPSGSDFVELSIGYNHALAVRDDGTLAAWGWDDHGQVSGLPAGSDFVAVAAGGAASLALRSDGTIAAFGRSSGNNSTHAADMPTGGGHTAIGMAHDGHWCAALDEEGRVVVWGTLAPYFGGTTPEPWGGCARFHVLSPVPAETGHTRLALGHGTGCAIAADGSLAVFGSDAFGLIADAPSGTFLDVRLAARHAVGLRADGSLVVWGRRPAFSFWDGTGTVAVADPRDDVPAGTGHVAVAATGWHTACFALTAAGEVVSWGTGLTGQRSGVPAGSGFTRIGGQYAMAAL